MMSCVAPLATNCGLPGPYVVGPRAACVATAELSRIDYRALNPDARTQYDTAKRFIRQADDAIRSKNLVFAKSFADKAATIAAQLGGR